MNLSGFTTSSARPGKTLLVLFLLSVFLAPPLLAQNAAEAAQEEEMSYEFREELLAPVRRMAADLRGERNENGKAYRRGVYSKKFTKIDDDTYTVSFQQDTASESTLTTERMLLTVKRKGGSSWEIVDSELVDTYHLYRQHGWRIYPFKKFGFDKGGLKLSASDGYMVESYFNEKVTDIFVVSDDLAYKYSPPKYRSYDKLYQIALKDHHDVLVFKPQLFKLQCDPETCQEFIAELFEGLERPAPEEAGPMLTKPSDLPDWVDSNLRGQYLDEHDDMMDQRRENPFAHFQRETHQGNRWYFAWIEETDKHAVGLRYDDWEGFEHQYYVYHSVPGSSFFQPIFGYFTDETLASHTTHELESRYDQNSRWYDLYKVKGEVDVALEDPEVVHGDVTFGLHLRNATNELPFFISSRQRGDTDKYKSQTMFVNSVEYEGVELTCVRTGPFSYIVVLPEEMPAGSNVELQLDFSSRVIAKINHSYSAMARQGWLPFVRFGDAIDEFDMIVKTPSKYDVLAIGRKVSEKVEGEVLETRWIADSPVTFPTIIFGKYRSDTAGFDATKADGTVIPVAVHVDEASFGSWEIRPDALRPKAEEAANAINLYRELSGVDYPYGELNLVVDPGGGLYGQSPSSIVYLGAPVFRGAAIVSSGSRSADDTSRFMRSVVAHEVGHQWWGARIAHANYRNYWFIESLAEFFSAIWLENVFGPDDYMAQVDQWRKTILDADIRASVQDSTTLWSGEFPGAATQASIYNKGPYAFHMLRQIFGDEKFLAAMKKICMDLAAKQEVTTEDMRIAAEAAFGGVGPDGNPYNMDLAWFFDQWVRGAGLPQYSFSYDTRQAEDGTWIVEGKVKQQVVVGNKTKFHVLDDTYYRGMVQITVTGKDKKEYPVRFPIEGPETPFAFKVPAQPREVVLNKHNKTLAHDVLVGRGF